MKTRQLTDSQEINEPKPTFEKANFNLLDKFNRGRTFLPARGYLEIG